MTSYQKSKGSLMALPDTPLRPAQYAEHQLVTGILEGRYPAGSTLPNERTLAEQLGITRPTLRETLRALASEGWVCIRHGKPTQVNDILIDGGLGCLGTLVRHRESLPPAIIVSLLKTREMLLPPAAAEAVRRAPAALARALAPAASLNDRSKDFATFDWQLQMAIVRLAANPILNLLYNDFAVVFVPLAAEYFAFPLARQASRRFYAALTEALDRSPETLAAAVREAMVHSTALWQRQNPARKPDPGDGA